VRSVEQRRLGLINPPKVTRMRNAKPDQRQSCFTATEVAQYVYCAKAWQLMREGATPHSLHLKPGARFHQRHSNQLTWAARLYRLGLASALLALILLFLLVLIWAASN
jgi:hypothetical protein